jgi:hypothetical protein
MHQGAKAPARASVGWRQWDQTTLAVTVPFTVKEKKNRFHLVQPGEAVKVTNLESGPRVHAFLVF